MLILRQISRFEPSLYRLPNAAFQFLHRVRLRYTTWKRRHFSPETAFISRVYDGLNFHRDSLACLERREKEEVISGLKTINVQSSMFPSPLILCFTLPHERRI